jgi:prepilin-type N-terminal cleavage/methylation domain-containing protein/prepilin-type processing-associated H-X9-DG protein
MPKKKGFTLIELLVVIAIIAILAAILFPVFARARENARRASCQSNLKQIALGVFQYTQDYDEKFPLHFANNDSTNVGFDASATGAGGPGKDQGWAELIQPYLKSRQIFQCPSETTAQGAEGSTSNYTDYMGNFSEINTLTGMVGMVAPAQTVMICDWLSAYSGSSFAYNYLYSNTANFNTDSRYRRHLEGNNFAFADGHVKWLKPEAVRSRYAESGFTAYTCGTGGTASPTTWAYTFCSN